MAKDEDDVLNQSEISYKNAKDFINNLQKSIKDYLDHKDDLKKYIMWDKVIKN